MFCKYMNFFFFFFTKYYQINFGDDYYEVYLLKFKNLSPKELKAFLDNNHFHSGNILYDIKKVKDKLLKDNISEKTNKIYLSMHSYYKHALQLEKLSASDQELKNLDKNFLKKISYQNLN